MSGSDELVIARVRWLMFLFLPLSVVYAALALFQLAALGDGLNASLNLLTAVLWLFAALVVTRPVARLNAASIAVGPLPVLAPRVIPWASITNATLSRMNILELTVAGNKPLKLAVDQVRKDQRQLLLDVIESHVGPVTRLS